MLLPAIAATERARIAEQYKKGKFYGSNLAIGIFDSPNTPLESVSNAQDKTFSRSPIGIFIVLGSAGLSIGLLFHHRRRLHNGYAPIAILKRRQESLQVARRKSAAAAAVNGKKPELTSLRQPNPVPANEETTIKHEQNERFAV